ncbi:hypothetical protein B565_3354 [Aeromonas veronii B565]|nr:hypothetical protein B565_3354 [Aeromonas veronii B565]
MGQSGVGKCAVFGWGHGLLHELEWGALSLMAPTCTIRMAVVVVGPPERIELRGRIGFS